MSYLGDLDPSDVLDTKFTTVTTTGAPTTLAGTPVISVYKDNSTTESTSGVTLTVDFDARTGMNNVRVDTSSDGTFYSAGSNFQIVITTGTVGGTSVVGYVVGEFSIRKRSALKQTTILAESYAAKGAAPTVAQALMAILQILHERSISGTTLTVKKLDGAATAETMTLNDPTTPTAQTRAS